MAGVDDEVQQLVVGRVDVEQVHPRRGDHHVAGDHVGHADHAFEHHPRLGSDDFAVLGVSERLDQLVARIGPGRHQLDEPLEQVAPLGAVRLPLGCAGAAVVT